MRDEVECMTVKEVMLALRLSRQTIYNMKNAGELPYFKRGKSTRFRTKDVEALICGSMRRDKRPDEEEEGPSE